MFWPKMNFVAFILLSAASIFPAQVNSSEFDTYGAAVVEFNPEFMSTGGSRFKPKNVWRNLEKYDSFIAEAKKLGADIVVFPEYGLADVLSHFVPDAQSHIVPCMNPVYSFEKNETAILKRLSCAAKANRIYVAVNLPEYRIIRTSTGKNGSAILNTNVVLDRDGMVVLRYSKFNAFDKLVFKKLQKPDYSYFVSDFGVRFGTFTGLDILFNYPASRLIKKYKIENLIYPTQWVNEWPLLTGISIQAGYSISKFVNLLAAGYNDPQNSLTGSGIYLGGIGPATSLLTNVAESKLLYARVPFRKLKSGNIKYTKESDLGLSDNSEDLKNLKNNPDWSKVFRLSSKNDLSEDSISLKIGKRYTTQACTKTDFCCTFKLNTRVVNPEGSNYYYYAIAYDGTQKFGNTSGGVQACAIVSCHVTRLCHPNHDKEAKHDFTVLEIEGDFNGNNSFQIPITLAYNNGFQTLSTDQYNFSSKRENTKMIIKKGVKNLYTFGIFSRDITKDADKYNGDEDEEDEDEVEDKVIGKAEDKEEEKVENGSKEMEKVESEDKEEEKHESIDQEEEKNPSKDEEEESKEESKEEGKNNGDVFSEIKESDSGSASYFTPVPTLMIAYLFYLILCH